MMTAADRAGQPRRAARFDGASVAVQRGGAISHGMYAASPRDRAAAAVAAVTVTGALGWALVLGLAGDRVRRAVDDGLAVFRVAPPAPPPPARLQPRPRVSARPEGRAAPPNIHSRATQVVAPVPVVVVPPPPPTVTVAMKPFAGDQATQGAAPVAGPGTGAGGVGDGTGSGGWGDGDGGGGSEIPPRWRSGRLKNSDYPDDLGESGVQGTVGVKYLVWTDGRVAQCEVTRSSGSRVLDDTTCRLIRQRFRFSPSRDDRGRPVPSWIVENHSWEIEREPAPAR